MNIAFFTHYASLYGANRSLINLVEGVSAQGHTVCLVSPGEGAITEYFREKGFSVGVFSFPWAFCAGEKTETQIVERVNCMERIMDMLCAQLEEWQVDLVYSNSLVIDIGLLAAKKIGKPHMWHIREYGDLDYDIHPDVGWNLYRRLLCASDGIVFISNALKEHMFPHCSHPNMRVIYNGVVAKPYFEMLLANCKKRAKKKVDTFCIVGYVTTKKGQAVAIRALSKVVRRYPDVKLLIAGGGDLATLHELTDELQVQRNVCVLGEVSDPFGIFTNSDASLMCSEHEAMGRVTAEAMVCACPVIGFNGGATPELITHGENGLLYEGGEEALATCMLKMIENPLASRIMGEKGREYALNTFTVEKCSGEVLKLMESIVQNSMCLDPREVAEENIGDYPRDKNTAYWNIYAKYVDLNNVIMKETVHESSVYEMCKSRSLSSVGVLDGEIISIESLDRGESIWIYGTGVAGKHFFSIVLHKRPDVTVLGFVDSFRDGQFEGRPIVACDHLAQVRQQNERICIASHAGESIAREICKHGMTYFNLVDVRTADIKEEAAL